jgi:putative photosynthetic complex assembly protein 2
MAAIACPILYALFVWWFSTGVIIYLDHLPPRTFRWSLLGAGAVAVASLWGLGAGRYDTSLTGTYLAFTEALLAWGWVEISFYMGLITGRQTERCPEGCSGWKHFGHAVNASIYHELLILALAAAVFALEWNGTNHVGSWTFSVLWWMHQSAKLNVFLGIPNLNEQFVPEHLQFLRSFLNQKPMNLLFPISVTASTIIGFLLLKTAFAGDLARPEAVGYLFVGTLMGLAVLEHWFLVLPMPAASLWNWSLRSTASVTPFDVEIVAGFLGAGKTTYLKRMLAAAAPDRRTLVLVNDFGALGIDASLLSGHGAQLLELSNGCICCSLTADLDAQLRAAIARWSPRRILIEPSGVANVAALLNLLGNPSFKPMVNSISLISIIDSASFMRDYGQMHDFMTAQIAIAPLLVVNKTDLVSAVELRVVEATLRAVNPNARIVRGRYGLVEDAAFDRDASRLLPGAASSDRHTHGPDWKSWSTPLSGVCSLEGLQDLLDTVPGGTFGQIDRVKGIVQSGSGWVHFDVAGGRTTVAAFAAGDGEEARVMAVGRNMDSVRLQAAFEACAGGAV